MPRVSICVPAYNSVDYIARTLSSILEQTYADLEVVVVDDCSTDGTRELLRSIEDPRLRLVENDANLGAVDNWNRALELTSGEFVKLVCGDDVLAPNCVERQVGELEAEPRASMAASQRDIVDARDRVLFRRRGLAGLRGYVSGDHAIRTAVRSGTNPFGEPFSVLMRRSSIERVGPFRDLAYVIDLDYWTRLLQTGGVVAIGETLGSFRVVPTSWSYRIGRQQSAQSTALFTSLRRQLPDVVTPSDLRIGAWRARFQTVARIVLYRLLRF